MGALAAILWAEWRCRRNALRRGSRLRRLLVGALAAFWYGGWTAGAVFLALPMAQAEAAGLLSRILLFVLFYWQWVPVLTASPGAAPDLKRLLVYPLAPSRLFRLELLLRLAAAPEMLLVLAGAAAGLVANPAAPSWGVAPLAAYAAMNLLLAAGVRNLLERLLARRYVREVLFVVLVLAAGLPQIAITRGAPEALRTWLAGPPGWWWPWTAAAEAAFGGGLAPWAVLAGWTAAAWAFGRRQFARSLCFDEASAGARSWRSLEESRWRRITRLVAFVWPDPAAALLEKELLCLSRSARFRLVFVMGFSFGLLVWLPLLLEGAPAEGSLLVSEYLTFVTAYALLLLGEVTFWNAFGMDRTGAQFYFAAPAPARAVLASKNAAALLAVFAEVSLVALVCALLRMPVTPRKLADAYAVALVLALYLLAAGNLASVHFPRAADPRAPWRSASGRRFQAALVFVYPVLALPVLTAFLVRRLAASEAAFYLTLAASAVLGAALYRYSLRRAAAALARRSEPFLAALREGAGPVLS
jgi:ABC-2 type transport system permease protein